MVNIEPLDLQRGETGLAVGESIIPMPAYQVRFLNDPTRIKLGIWCRQAGKDFTASLEAVLDAPVSKQPWYIISLTERQALNTINECKRHCRAISMLLPHLGVSADPQIIDEVVRYKDAENKWVEIKAKRIEFAGGGSITALPGKDPDAIAGLHGNIIFTEFALFPNNGIDHWRVVFPLITRGYKLRAITTPRGPDTKCAELRRNRQGKYSVHEVDIHRALREGLVLRDEEGQPITAEALEVLYDDAMGWSREYLLIESNEMMALISWADLERAQDDYDLVRREVTSVGDYDPSKADLFAFLKDTKNPLYLGWDVARKSHLSSVWINEKIGDRFKHVAMVNMRGMPFPYMRSVVAQAMGYCRAGRGDATGLGMESCEGLERQFPGKFEGVNFSSAKKEICVRMMQVFQDGRQTLSRRESDVVHDIHGINKEIKGETLKFHETKNPENKHSHCDMAYGNGLALHAGAHGGLTPGIVTLATHVDGSDHSGDTYYRRLKQTLSPGIS